MFPFYSRKYDNLSILSDFHRIAMETISRWNAALERQNGHLVDRLIDHGRLRLDVETENVRLKNEIYRLNAVIAQLKKEKQAANDRTAELFRECDKQTLALVELIGENMKSEEEIDRLKFDLSLKD